MHKRLRSIAGLLFFILCILLAGCSLTPQNAEERLVFPPDERIVGITIDDGWYEDLSVSEIVSAVKKMPVKPTVRIVMSREMAVEEYVPIFRALHSVAYVMATPVDSYEMASYPDISSYRERFIQCEEILGEWVDLWEIGNEINGDWLGDEASVSEKMFSAFQEIRQRGGRCVLTAYYTKPKMQSIEMEEWLERYVPREMKEELDYLFVSYYEDDNEGYRPDWQKIFDHLGSEFPHSKLGIGECGFASADVDKEEKIERIRSYYKMPKYHENYVGGYFWWYWVQDCLMQEDSVLELFCDREFLLE